MLLRGTKTAEVLRLIRIVSVGYNLNSLSVIHRRQVINYSVLVRRACAAALLMWLLAPLSAYSSESNKVVMQVKASAYNSVAEQTNAQPAIAAWGDELRPGMKVLAVSRDLLRDGLTYGTQVRIEGLKGLYVVMDKMNKRWSRKIDIYMGDNVDAARQWGVREVTISWQDPAAES